MKRKTAFILICCIVVSVLAGCGETNKRIYDTDNVYEEIQNLIIYEESGKGPALSELTEGSYADYDVGVFQSVVIPEYRLSISMSQYGLLHLLFFDEEKGEYHSFAYDDENDKLYGDCEEAYLTDNFLKHYFSLMGDDSEYSAEDKGKYTYEFAENVFAIE